MIAPGAPILRFDAIDSTNLEARRRAEAGDFGPAYLIARTQTAGRGRRGRAWVSEAGNLFLTYLGATQAPPAKLALLGFCAAVALAELAEAHAGAAKVALKWPNDLLLNAAKAAGILLESGALTDGRQWFALGIGVNLIGAPEDLGRDTAHFAAFGRALTPEAAFAALRPRLEHWAATLAGEGFAPVREAWLARGPTLGEAMAVHSGETMLSGRFAGLSGEGALRLSLDDGQIREIVAGEVFAPAPSPN